MAQTSSETASFELVFQKAFEMQKAGQYTDAIALYNALLQQSPANTDVLNLIGLSHYQNKNFKEAVQYLQRAVKLCDDYPDYRLNYGSALRADGQDDEAAKQFRKVIKLSPDSWQARFNLARIFAKKGKEEMAEKMYREAAELNPGSWAAKKGIADMLFNQKKFNGARPIYEEYLQHNPEDYETLLALGSIYFSQFRHVEAEALLRRAVRFPNPAAEAYFFHGQSLRQMGRNDDAKGAYKMALSVDPNHFETRIQLYDLTSYLGQLNEADQQIEYIRAKEEWRDKALAQTVCMKHFINSCNHQAMAEMPSPLLHDDVMNPEYTEHFSLAGLVQAHDDAHRKALFKLHKIWGENIAKLAHQDFAKKHRKNTGKIKVGFLSSDLRRHSVGKFAFPLLTQYDRDKFEFYCYTSANDDGDLVQEELRRNVDSFVFLGHRNYEEIAERIAEDNLDILIEMNGFTLGGRMAALAYKPAPVQVEWLGYPYTTGLESCDYFLVDEYLKPEKKPLMTEEPLVLQNGCFICFGEFEPVPIATQLPLEKNGYITFGSLNNIYKLTPQTVDYWADVMNKVSNSRLLIVRKEFQWAKMRDNLIQEFGRKGISADRLNFTQNYHANFLEHYNDMDISLDTLPLTGGTTTADALWMGVPVVSLAGEQVHERISHSILNYTGTPELSVKTRDEYVKKAVALSGDPAQLKKYRQNLRGMMQASSLCRTDIFIDNFQHMLEDLVKKHELHA